ncbi:putative helicase senataxin, partial [Frankliniella fusca]
SVLSDASTVLVKQEQEPPDLAELPVICALQGNAHELWSDFAAEEATIKQEDEDGDYPAEGAAEAAAPLLPPTYQVRVKREPQDELELQEAEAQAAQARRRRDRRQSSADSVEEWSAYERRKATQSFVQVKAEPTEVDTPRLCAAQGPGPRVKQERMCVLDEDEEVRRTYFCGQGADGLVEDLDAPVVEDKEEDEEDSSDRPARQSTTLHRAMEPKVDPEKFEELKKDAARCKAQYEQFVRNPARYAAAAIHEDRRPVHQTARPKSPLGARPPSPKDRQDSRPSAGSTSSPRIRPVEEKPSTSTSSSSETGAARRPRAERQGGPQGGPLVGPREQEQEQLCRGRASDANSSSTCLSPDSEAGKHECVGHRDPRVQRRQSSPTLKVSKREGGSMFQGDDLKRCRLEEQKPALDKRSPMETRKRSSESPENEGSPPQPSKKRVLPPATRVTNYDTRSPLYDEYEEPRKSYNQDTYRMSTPRDRFLHTICKWRPEWITQSEVVSKKKIPDLLGNGENYEERVRNLLQFSSGDEYCKHFQDGLFLELWNNLCKITIKGRKQKPILIAAKVDGEPQEIPLLGHTKRRTLTCHFGSDDKTQLSKGDLVIVSALENSKHKSYFAYVVGDPKKNLISDTVKLSSRLRELCPAQNFTYKLSIPLMVVVKGDNLAEPQTIISIERVKDISDDLETYVSLETFVQMNLSLSSLLLEPQYIPLLKSPLPVKYESELTREQKLVLQSILGEICDRGAPSVSVVHGGPGTGKSYLAAVLAKELASQSVRQKRCFVILSSKSNYELNVLAGKLRQSSNNIKEKGSARAVWCGCSRKFTEFENLKDISLNSLLMKNKPSESILSLVEQRDLLKKEIKTEEAQIKKLTASGRSAQYISHSCAKKILDVTLLENKINEEKKPVAERNISPTELLKKCDMLLTTFSPPRQFLEAYAQMRKGKTETEINDERVVLIVDNASEVVEPTIIKTIVNYNVTDVVLFGDTKQHVPFVPYMGARNYGLHVSLMERYSKALKDKGPPFRQLSNQFRLHPVVFNAVNKIFYDDAMRYPENVRKAPIKPYIWFNCPYIHQERDEVAFLEKLLRAVCMIKPYNTKEFRLQSVRITSLCPKISQAMVNSSSEAKLYVAPNHLNSSEFDLVILSVGKVTKERASKIITPWTRAKRSLLVVGNFDSLHFTHHLSKLLVDAQSNKNLMTITNRGESSEELAAKIRA